SLGLEGGVAEIGVFFGRSYFLLRKITAPENKVVAIDLFEIGDVEDGVSEQYKGFLKNGAQLGLPVDEELVIAGDSSRVAPSDILKKVGRVRFFSIDGGHMLPHLAADSALAGAVLAAHGVIAFDDTFNPTWPEVTVGVSDFLRENDEFCAFCMTKYKTYVCKREFHDFYRAVIDEAPHLEALEHSETEFLGAAVVRLHNPLGRRIAYEIMTRSGMGAISEHLYRGHKPPLQLTPPVDDGHQPDEASSRSTGADDR
ncbi:MAG: class I SAM-dependent methyltransferase, partial [Ensifer adhaerens]